MQRKIKPKCGDSERSVAFIGILQADRRAPKIVGQQTPPPVLACVYGIRRACVKWIMRVGIQIYLA